MNGLLKIIKLESQKYVHTSSYTWCKHREREREREREKQRERQTDRQRERQRETETDFTAD